MTSQGRCLPNIFSNLKKCLTHSKSINLLSIPQITKGLNSSAKLTRSKCFFQDLIVKVIGHARHAREDGGLYLLEDESGTTSHTPHTSLSENPTIIEEQVWLFHLRLGHPHFLLLKI